MAHTKNKKSTEQQLRAYKKYRSGPKYARTYINNHLKRKYGITYETYIDMFNSQNQVCKICKQLFKRKSQTRDELMPLFVDHCHTTGMVRGLLCSKCNTGLGMFQDNIEILNSAINYLNEATS